MEHADWPGILKLVLSQKLIGCVIIARDRGGVRGGVIKYASVDRASKTLHVIVDFLAWRPHRHGNVIPFREAGWQFHCWHVHFYMTTSSSIIAYKNGKLRLRVGDLQAGQQALIRTRRKGEFEALYVQNFPANSGRSEHAPA